MNPTYDEILKANALRGNVIRKTPLIHSPTFSDLTNSEIFLKEEFRQKTGSFKIRGAYYKIKSLSSVSASIGAPIFILDALFESLSKNSLYIPF